MKLSVVTSNLSNETARCDAASSYNSLTACFTFLKKCLSVQLRSKYSFFRLLGNVMMPAGPFTARKPKSLEQVDPVTSNVNG